MKLRRYVNKLRKIKVRRKRMKDPYSEIIITDSIKISALQSEVNYWKTRYELLLKYGDTTIKFMQVSG